MVTNITNRNKVFNSLVNIEVNRKAVHSTYRKLGNRTTLTHWTSSNIKGNSVRAKSAYSGKILLPERNQILNITSNSLKSKEITIKASPKSKPTKPLKFIFNTPVGVTQWFGKTRYQKKHTGIDFAVYKKTVISPSKGTVSSYAWDSYYGKCLSGGNILKIKHSPKLYTVYMHLKSSFVEKGKTVNNRQPIGITGNSGAYNCRPLGYHLHLETRTSARQKDAANPVKYIDTDWSKIRTVGANKYPGRLTGSNPHPSY